MIWTRNPNSSTFRNRNLARNRKPPVSGLIQENGALAASRLWFNDPSVAQPSRLEIGAPAPLAEHPLFS